VAVYNVKAPDGGTYQVTGPDDATHEQITFAAYQQMMKEQAPEAKTSVTGTLLHGAERSAGPLAAGVAGFGVAAAPFVETGPLAIIPGLIGGAIAGWGAEKAQKAALDRMPKVTKALGLDEAQQAAEEKEHPIASVAGELLPQAAAFEFNPVGTYRALKTAAGLGMHALNAGIGAGQTAATEAVQGQPLDWKQIGLSGAVGALMGEPTRIGRGLMNAGDRMVPGYAARHAEAPTAPPASPAPTEVTPQPAAVAKPAPSEQIPLPLENPRQPPQQVPLPFEEPAEPAPAPGGKQLELPLAGPPGQMELGLNEPAHTPAPQAAPIPQLDLFNRQPTPVAEASVAEGKAPKQTVLPFEPGSKMEPAIKESRKQAVLEHVQANPDGVTRDEVMAATKIERPPEVIGHLNTLKKEGLVSYDSSLKKWVPVKEGVSDVRNELPVARPDRDAPVGSGVGVEVPVREQPANAAAAEKPVPRGVDDHPANPNGPAVGEKAVESSLDNIKLPDRPLVENDPREQAIREKALAAYQDKHIDEDQLSHIDRELRKENPNYELLDKSLDASRSRQEELMAALLEKVNKYAGPEKTGGAPVAATESAEDRQMREYYERRKAEDAAEKDRIRNRRSNRLSSDEDDYLAEQRQNNLKPGLNRNVVQDVIDRATSDWTNKPGIVVHQSHMDLPDYLKHVPKSTIGVYRNGYIHFIADNIKTPSEARAKLFHEALGHYGLADKFGTMKERLLRAVYATNDALRSEADKWVKAREGKEFYRNFTPDQMKVRAAEEILAERSEKGPIKNTGLRAAFNKVVAAVRNFGRRNGLLIGFSDNDVAQILRQAHEQVMNGKASEFIHGQGDFLAQRVKVPPSPPRTTEETEQLRDQRNAATYRDKYGKEGIVKRIYKTLATHEGREEAIRNLANYERPLQQLQEYVNRSGGSTNVYDMARSHSTAMAEYHNKTIDQYHDKLNSAIGRFMQKSGMNLKDALNRLHTYAIAAHEPERRWQKYVENVPLENTKKFGLNGVSATAADHRKAILSKYYKENKDLTGLAAKDRADLEMLARTHADKDGYTDARHAPKSIDINDRGYDVLGPYTRDDIRNFQDTLKSDRQKYGPEIDELFDITKKIGEETIRLNRLAKYHPQQVDNLIALYGWEHYMPFKGDPNVSEGDNRFERGGKGLSGELNQFAEKTEGRHTDSENPFLQTVADAARAASRAGRDGFTAEIGRLVREGFIKGKQLKSVSFDQRQDDLTKRDIDGKSHVFDYRPDGSIDIYKITDPKMLEAIKGFNGDIGAFWKGLNSVTSAIGQWHTRFNVGFPPYNFVRHATTSAMTVGAENSPMLGGKFLTSIIGKVFDGGLYKAAKVARMFHEGDIAGIKALADKNPGGFYSTVHDYLVNGGRATWSQGLAIKTQQEQLAKSTGPKGFMTAVDHVKQYFNIWSDMFEFASRAAGYGTIRDHLISEAKAQGKDINEEAIKLQASQYVKKLFDFSQVGKYGREVGSAFMFLRPAMTTAVRSIDALSPAFLSVDKAVARMPARLTDPKIIAKAEGLDEAAAEARAAEYKKTFVADHIRRQKAARIMATGMMGAGYGLYTMAMLASETDSQGRNKVATDNMELWSRNIRLPAHGMLGKDNDYFQIPWGWGLGAFGAMGAQIAGATMGKSNLMEAVSNMIPVALESYFPIPTPKYSPIDHPIAFTVGSMTPTFARPLIEYGMNVDEFGREIYKNRMNQFGDAYSGGENLPELYGAATRMMSDATDGKVDISPNTLHFFANSYLDGLARMAHNTYGMALTMTGQKEFDPKRDLGGVFDSFIGKSSSFDAREFSDVESKIKKQQGILTMYKDSPEMLDKYLDAHPNALMLDNIYNATINGQLKSVRHQLNALQSDTSQSPKEKADEIKDLKEQRDWIMRSFLDQYHDYD
jgi:hypothetical protein